jgi:rubrerythrin
VALSNFNLLLFLGQTSAFTPDEFTALCTAIARRDHARLEEVKTSWPSWRSLMEQARAAAGTQRPSTQQVADWQCPHCTFLNLNRPTDSCEICGLPNH